MRLALFALPLLFAGPVAAQAPAADWPAQKCALYEEAWSEALDQFGSDDMNYAFLAGNENFIVGGCTEGAMICPQSRQELDVANALTLAMMNNGTASTFLPFKCPRPEAAADSWTEPGL